MSWYRDWIFYTLTIATFVMDRISKEIIVGWLPLGSQWPEQGIFQIVHGVNTGSAFGLFQGFTNILIIASVIGIIFVLFVFHRQSNQSLSLRLSLGLIVGGALGNLFDRVVDGGVVDFISVGWWPAFNVADSAISIGMFLLVVTVLFGERLGMYTRDEGSS